MGYAQPYGGQVAANAIPQERADFIRKTYMHLLGAVLAFAALEAFLLQTQIPVAMLQMLSGSRYGWLVVMFAFMGVSWLAESWARSGKSTGMQYAGLALYVGAEAIITLPLLFIAARFCGEGTIPAAVTITAALFGGMTAVVFITGADFSFMRTALYFAGLVALVLIGCSIVFGFTLGLLFVGAMIVLSCGYILYHTSNVLHHYQVGQHVAASLTLFASVALLFWYVLRLVMALNSRD